MTKNLTNIEKAQLESIIKRAKKYDLRFYLGLATENDKMVKYSRPARRKCYKTFRNFVASLESLDKKDEANNLWNDVYKNYEAVRQIHRAFKGK
jgi:hypothetical protein